MLLALAVPASSAMHGGGGGHGGGGHGGGGHMGGFHGGGGHQSFRGDRRGFRSGFGGGFVCLPWQAEQGICYLPGY
jgi:hypothetical protein